MSRCRQCKVEILDETERCPLCDCVLEQTIEVENMYPNVRIKAKKMQLFGRIYLFAAIVAVSIMLAINVMMESGIWWSLIVGLPVFYGYLLIRFAILGKTGYRIKALVLTLFAILMLIGIDFLEGYHGWSFNYVVPSGIILMDIGIIVLMLVNHRNWQSYLMIQIIMILCSFVPILFIFLGIVTEPILSEAAMAFSVFLFLGTVIIGNRRAKVELKRRFHIR